MQLSSKELFFAVRKGVEVSLSFGTVQLNMYRALHMKAGATEIFWAIRRGFVRTVVAARSGLVPKRYYVEQHLKVSAVHGGKAEHTGKQVNLGFASSGDSFRSS